MIRALLAGLIAAGAIAPAALPGQDAASIVGRAGRIYRNLSSLKAGFEQIIEDRAQGDTLTGSGTIMQAGENYFAMRFNDPPGEAIVVDGEHVWIYTPSTAPKQVYRSPVPTDPIYGVNLLAMLLDRPHERYTMSYVRRDSLGRRSAHVVDLVPSSRELPFRKARLWIDAEDGLPRRIELDEGIGLRRILTFDRLQPNAPYDSDTFKFVVPPGVKVIRQG